MRELRLTIKPDANGTLAVTDARGFVHLGFKDARIYQDERGVFLEGELAPIPDHTDESLIIQLPVKEDV